jgi:hypothetical protein
LVEIVVVCSNIEILAYRELAIIFATKTDNSITPKMVKLSIINNDNFRYINTICVSRRTTIVHWMMLKVTNVNEWYFWLNHTVKPNVRVQQWYNGKPPYGLRGYLDDKSNRIIGYAIIRQIREEQGTCKVPNVLRDSIKHCTGVGGLHTEDDHDYCVGWKPKLPGMPCNESEEYM